MNEKIEHWKRHRDRMAKKNKQFLQNNLHHKGKALDRLADEITEDVFKDISCLECGNCCKSIPPIVTHSDSKKISKFLNQSEMDFEEKYLIRDEDGDTVMSSSPCVFLEENNLCKIYEVRPRACSEYPHTDKGQFSANYHLHATNTLYCPAVFYVMEEVKKRVI